MLADIGEKNEGFKNWLVGLSILIGYFKWISFFRVFDSTRRLIKAIVDVLKDTRAFAVVIIFIIFGFSITFLEFNRN